MNGAILNYFELSSTVDMHFIPRNMSLELKMEIFNIIK
jgi:hypothetical protein